MNFTTLISLETEPPKFWFAKSKSYTHGFLGTEMITTLQII